MTAAFADFNAAAAVIRAVLSARIKKNNVRPGDKSQQSSEHAEDERVEGYRVLESSVPYRRDPFPNGLWFFVLVCARAGAAISPVLLREMIWFANRESGSEDIES
jgi:hypothetical protein